MQYRGSFFKVRTMSQWMVVVSGTRYIEEIRNASEEYLSFHEALIQVIPQSSLFFLRSSWYFLADNSFWRDHWLWSQWSIPYQCCQKSTHAKHPTQVRGHPRWDFSCICGLYTHRQRKWWIQFDLLPRSWRCIEWIKVNAYSTMMNIVCRTSNRVFVGLPLGRRLSISYSYSSINWRVHIARDPDFMSLNKEFTINIMTASRTINQYPSFLRL